MEVTSLREPKMADRVADALYYFRWKEKKATAAAGAR